jgi:hypothetical protein
MTIMLDHTFVLVADKNRGAHLFGDLIGAQPGPPAGLWSPWRSTTS